MPVRRANELRKIEQTVMLYTIIWSNMSLYPTLRAMDNVMALGIQKTELLQ